MFTFCIVCYDPLREQTADNSNCPIVQNRPRGQLKRLEGAQSDKNVWKDGGKLLQPAENGMLITY